jgi:hypothetical protein
MSFGVVGQIPKMGIPQNKSGKSGSFSSLKNDRQRTSISPATHHKFTSENHVQS